MRSIFATLMAILLAAAAQAQVTVQGTVVDQQKQPLPGATVTLYIQNTKHATVVTDNNGYFAFANIARNALCRLTVQHIGKKTAEQTFTASENQSLAFSLQDLAYLLEPLEIKALRASDKMPFTKTDISAQDLAKTNTGQDIPYLVDQTPSIYVSSDAGNAVGYTYMHIRGSDATRINVTLNGIPYNDAESEGTYFVDVPDLASSAGSIQIQRGVGTSTNGSGAFGATMNISTNEFNPQAYAESNNSIGSFNTFKNTIRLGSGLIGDHFTLDARFSQVSSDGYIDRAFSNMQSMYLSGLYVNKKTSVRFNFLSGREKTYQAWYGIDSATLATDRKYNPAGEEMPGGPYPDETDNYWQQHYQLFINQAINNAWSLNVATFLSRGYGYYQEYHGVAAEEATGDSLTTAYATYGLPNPVYGNDTVTNTDFIRQLWLNNWFYGQTFNAQYKQGRDEVTMGGSWTIYSGWHTDNIIWAQYGGIPNNYVYYNLPARKTDQDFYAKWLHDLNDRWSLFADMQYRHVMHTMDGFEGDPTLDISRTFNFFNPKAGVSYNYQGWRAYFSYAKAGKEPDRDDFQASLQQQPNAEILNDFELGIGRKTHQYNWAVTLYDMIYYDQLVLTGKLNDVGEATRINVPNSYRLGIELEGGYVFARWANITGNLTFSKNKIKSFTEYLDDYDNGLQVAIQHNNTDISYSPAVIGGFTLNFLPLQNLELTTLCKYVSNQYLDNTQNSGRMLNGFYTQDFRAIYTIKHLLFKEWSIIGQVYNLFNKLYDPNGATYPYIAGGAIYNDDYYQPVAGTNFMLAVNVKF